ncbi:hypothetical protein ANTQUA_LOCUS10552 [Anthophora quadrimaculata]
MQVFPIVIVLRIELRLFCPSRTVVVARFASGTSFRLEAIENQHSTTLAYLTSNSAKNRIAAIIPFQNRGCSEMCFRNVLCIEAFANQGSTTVAYTTWDYIPNNTTQVFSVVKILRIELRQYYLSRTVVAARYTSDACNRLEAFENQHSTTVAYSTWYNSRNTALQVFSKSNSAEKCIAAILRFENRGGSEIRLRHVLSNRRVLPIVIVLRIELRLFCPSRTVVVARFASGTSFRLEAFENQHSTTLAYLTRYNSRNTAPQLFPEAIVLRTELRLFYLSRTVVVARFASGTSFRLEAFENQNSTTVAYSTCNSAENRIAAIIPFQNRGCSDMCFRNVLCIEAFANQGSTVVAFSTWDYSPNNTTQVFSVVKILRIELLQYYLSRTLVAARYTSDACNRLEAFENQHSTTVAYSKWYNSRNTALQVFSIVIVLRNVLRLFCVSRNVVVARFASGTSFRIEAFENQHSTTVPYLTRCNSRNTAPQLFPVAIVLRTELRLFDLSRTVVVVRCASDTCFRLEAFENQNSPTVAYATWDCR